MSELILCTSADGVVQLHLRAQLKDPVQRLAYTDYMDGES